MNEYIVPFTDDADMDEFERLHGTNGELIRCDDCRFLFSVLCPMAHEKDGLTVFRNDIDDYCSRAERKEE